MTFFSCAPLRFRRVFYGLALLASLSASAVAVGDGLPPAWWSTGNPAPVKSSGNQPLAAANIGQAKYMAKCALDALYSTDPVVANLVSADLVGVGKPIPSWTAPAAGSPEAQAQFAPLLVGQLKAISAPFYAHLKFVDSAWLVDQMVQNGTATPEASTYFPWTETTDDDANKAIATVGQLKAVFALRFDTLLSEPADMDEGVDDTDVEITGDPSEDALPQGEGDVSSSSFSIQAASAGVSAAAPSISSYCQVQYRLGKLPLYKYGWAPFGNPNQADENRRYLTRKNAVQIAGVNGIVINAPVWRLGGWDPLDIYGRSPEVYYDSESYDLYSIDPFSNNYTSYRTGNLWPRADDVNIENLYGPIWWQWEQNVDRGILLQPYYSILDVYTNRTVYRNAYMAYDIYPYTSAWYDDTAKAYYRETLENENTLAMMKQAAIDHAPAYPTAWTNGNPWGVWDIQDDEMGINYRRFQFRFKKKSGVGNMPGVTVGIFFSPKDDGPEELLKSVYWNGKTNFSKVSTVDPQVLKPGVEGKCHIGLASVYFELDRAQEKARAAGNRVMLKKTNDGAVGKGVVALLKFPGINSRTWLEGASITLTQTSGSGSVRFKVINPVDDSEVIVPLNSNLAANFFSKLGQYYGWKWKVEGIDTGNVTIKLSYVKNSVTMAASCQATVAGLDLDVDSDNTGLVEGSAAEETLESDSSKIGKIVFVSPSSLNDPDGLPNTTDNLVEIILKQDAFSSTDKVMFSYSGSNPGGTTSTTAGGIVFYKNAPGALRIWKKPASGPPNSSSLYVEPNKLYSYSELGINSGSQKSFFIQGVNPSQVKTSIEVKYTSSSGVAFTDKVIVSLFPVDFITPAGDPVNVPIDAGNSPVSIPDGANEFTFSTATVGALTMNLKAKVPGIGSMPAAEQAKFTFELDAIGNSTFSWNGASPAGKATVSGDFITATATYTGLPQNNSDFGLKRARIKFGGVKIAEDDFEVFFPRDATNHPMGQVGSANWFYYWMDGQVCGIPPSALYDTTHVGEFGWTQAEKDSILRLCPDAPKGGGIPLTLTSTLTKPGSNPPATYGTITVGSSGKGIQCVAETVSHELYHLTMFADLAGKNYVDVDVDGVADSSEENLGGIQTSPTEPDTYGLSNRVGYEGYAAFADEEIRGMKQESNVTFPVFPKKDWANPGCQTANQNGPQP